MFHELFEKLGRREDLTQDEAAGAMDAVMEGRATPVQISALLMGLAMKGARAGEIAGLARAMRNHAVKLPVEPGDAIDLCGTGGDHSGTFNISSVAAIVVSGCGVRVAKHGNRGVSSQCGSADLFEALGVNILAPPAGVAACIDRAGIGFLFAPLFHPAMHHAAPVRRELKVRTAFNLLGPLTNPARPPRQLLGVPRPDFTELVAKSLVSLGSDRAWVVHGAGGLDELSTTGYSKVSECREGRVRTFYVHPRDFGLPEADLDSLGGGTPEENAAIAMRVLTGEPGPARDVTLMNAAAALFVAGVAASLGPSVERAAEAIDSGRALQALEAMVRVSNERDAQAKPESRGSVVHDGPGPKETGATEGAAR